MSIEEYFGDWSKVIDLKEADRLMKRLCSQHTCPLPKDIFKAFLLCPLHNLRVVLIGQDPYPQKGVATGLAFANAAGTPITAYSPSLEILRESVIDFTLPHGITNFDPSLEKWAEQGVLLLNTALTCQVGKIGSHTLLWRPFMKSLLTNLSEQLTGIVYVLMGNMAQTLEPYISKSSNHVIKIRHPSYYARTGTPMPSDIWRQINRILISINGYGIQWYEETN